MGAQHRKKTIIKMILTFLIFPTVPGVFCFVSNIFTGGLYHPHPPPRILLVNQVGLIIEGLLTICEIQEQLQLS